jgi:hypothetical protein
MRTRQVRTSGANGHRLHINGERIRMRRRRELVLHSRGYWISRMVLRPFLGVIVQRHRERNGRRAKAQTQSARTGSNRTRPPVPWQTAVAIPFPKMPWADSRIKLSRVTPQAPFLVAFNPRFVAVCPRVTEMRAAEIPPLTIVCGTKRVAIPSLRALGIAAHNVSFLR